MQWDRAKSPSIDDITALAERAFAALPKAFRDQCGDVTIRVEEFPDDEVMAEMGLETPFDLLGLYSGVAAPHRSVSDPGGYLNMVFLYRRPLLDYWAEYDETLGDLVRHVLIHEIGHHMGFSDDDMHAIEDAAG